MMPTAGHDDSCRALGQAMNECRKEAGMSVSVLAWFVGVSPLRMQRFLRDARKLSWDQFRDIALALQVSLRALVSRAAAIAERPAH
jgi:hypothetical protein